MSTAELVVMIILASMTVVMLVTWLKKRRSYQDKQYYNTREVITLYTLPRAFFAETILLLIFLNVNEGYCANKLHLLYLYPIVYYSINLMVARRVTKADKENRGSQLRRE